MLLIFILGSLSCAAVFYLFLYIKYNHQIFSIENAPTAEIILVPGAGIEPDNTPSDILKDRLISLSNYIYQFPVTKTILSGASNNNNYDETIVMKTFLERENIIPKNLELDPFGFSTFDSLKNFALTNSSQKLIITSQRFHLTRALYIADLLDLQAIGLVADNINFSILNKAYWFFREIISTPYNLIKYIFHNLRI